MARPAKSVNVQNSNLTSYDKTQRGKIENDLKGKKSAVSPAKELTKNQKKIFKTIQKHLETSNLLGELDGYIMTTCAIAIDRLACIEKMIDERPSLLSDSAFMGSKDKYTKDLYRCCNELCLSPQSRAKISSAMAAAAKQQEDPLVKALTDDD